MTITSSGMRCDVCGNYILFEAVNYFKVDGLAQMLHGDDTCWKAVQKAQEKGKWELLPGGPLRRTFEEAQKKLGGEK